MGLCIDGCVSCVVAPEQNLHGVLAAKETVSKLLLDAFYRRLVCDSTHPEAALRYPGTLPARTVHWSDLAGALATGMGRSLPGAPPLTIELRGSGGLMVVTVIPRPRSALGSGVPNELGSGATTSGQRSAANAVVVMPNVTWQEPQVLVDLLAMNSLRIETR